MPKSCSCAASAPKRDAQAACEQLQSRPMASGTSTPGVKVDRLTADGEDTKETNLCPFTAYPRITYVIAVRVATLVDLTVARAPRTLLTPCLDPNDVTASQELGEFLRSQGAQAIMFPSAIPGFTGQNVVVFRDATPPPEILLVNRDQILRELRRLVERLEQ
jgi:hypothetical protein